MAYGHMVSYAFLIQYYNYVSNNILVFATLKFYVVFWL